MAMPNRSFIDRIARVLDEKNITLNIKEGNSPLKVFSATERFSSSSELINKYTDMFVAELDLYKNKISPLVKLFKDEVTANTKLIIKNRAVSVPYKTYSVPLAFDHIVSTKDIRPLNFPDFKVKGEIIVINENADLLSVDELSKLFTSTGDENLDKYIKEILVKFGQYDLKKLHKDYCTSFTSANGNRNIFALAEDLMAITANLDEFILVYAYIQGVRRREVSTNLPSDQAADALYSITENLEKIFGAVLKGLDIIKNDKIAFLSVPKRKLATDRLLNESRKSYDADIETEPFINIIFKEQLDEILENAAIDGLGAILGATDTVSSVFGFKVDNGTVNEILANEDKLVAQYKSYIRFKEESKINSTITNIKQIIMNVSTDIYSSHLDAELRDIVTYSEEEFLDKVKNYINGITADEILNTESNKMSFEVIGKILFHNTNYYKFALFTDSSRFANTNLPFVDKLKDRDFIFLAAIELLADSLISEISAN